jgi:hypothetical protein
MAAVSSRGCQAGLLDGTLAIPRIDLEVSDGEFNRVLSRGRDIEMVFESEQGRLATGRAVWRTASLPDALSERVCLGRLHVGKIGAVAWGLQEGWATGSPRSAGPQRPHRSLRCRARLPRPEKGQET